MAKPKTKGNPIQVRLDLFADSILRERALAAGLSPAEYIGRQVVAEIRGVRGKIAPVVPTPVVVVEDHPVDQAHTHRKKTVNGAGLHVCECDAIRGNDGEWRQV